MTTKVRLNTTVTQNQSKRLNLTNINCDKVWQRNQIFHSHIYDESSKFTHRGTLFSFSFSSLLPLCLCSRGAHHSSSTPLCPRGPAPLPSRRRPRTIKPTVDQLQLGRRTAQISPSLGAHVDRGAAWQREVAAGGEVNWQRRKHGRPPHERPLPLLTFFYFSLQERHVLRHTHTKSDSLACLRTRRSMINL